MLDLFEDSARLIVANAVSDAIMACPSLDYVRSMEAGGPRKIWTLRDNDILVTAVPVPQHMVHYACQSLGLNATSLRLLAPAQHPSFFLFDNVQADEQTSTELQREIKKRSRLTLQPFLLDQRALAFARAHNLPIAYYETTDPHAPVFDAVVELIYNFNRKSFFRSTCQSLSIPVPAGITIETPRQLREAVYTLFTSYEVVIVKRDRGSNGFGHVTLQRQGTGLEDALRTLAATLPNTPVVVEEFFPVRWVPSFEYLVTARGPELLYACDMRCVNCAWVGMTIPPIDMPNDLIKAMDASGMRFAQHVYELGYRGVLDLDGIATAAGRWAFTETNFRTTGGTHMHIILSRLLGKDYLTHSWCAADNLVANGISFAHLKAAMDEQGLTFNPECRAGVVITADGTLTDRKLRYLVMGRPIASVLAMERQLRAIAQTQGAPDGNWGVAKPMMAHATS